MKAAHRAQQLATERLRLAVEECIAVAATFSAATQHLHAIQKEAGAGREGTTATTLLPPQQEKHATLQREVQHVTKEVCCCCCCCS